MSQKLNRMRDLPRRLTKIMRSGETGAALEGTATPFRAVAGQVTITDSAAPPATAQVSFHLIVTHP
jgi:hypothetical protein